MVKRLLNDKQKQVDRERKAKKRALESAQERGKRLESDASRHKQARTAEATEVTEVRLAKQQIRTLNLRINYSDEKKLAEKNKRVIYQRRKVFIIGRKKILHRLFRSEGMIETWKERMFRIRRMNVGLFGEQRCHRLMVDTLSHKRARIQESADETENRLAKQQIRTASLRSKYSKEQKQLGRDNSIKNRRFSHHKNYIIGRKRILRRLFRSNGRVETGQERSHRIRVESYFDYVPNRPTSLQAGT